MKRTYIGFFEKAKNFGTWCHFHPQYKVNGGELEALEERERQEEFPKIGYLVFRNRDGYFFNIEEFSLQYNTPYLVAFDDEELVPNLSIGGVSYDAEFCIWLSDDQVKETIKPIKDINYYMEVPTPEDYLKIEKQWWLVFSQDAFGDTHIEKDTDNTYLIRVNESALIIPTKILRGKGRAFKGTKLYGKILNSMVGIEEIKEDHYFYFATSQEDLDWGEGRKAYHITEKEKVTIQPENLMLLDGKLVLKSSKAINDSKQAIVQKDAKPTTMQAEDIVLQVENYLKESGRQTSYNDIINYLTCITQGFITTFAGAPGTGKTSLCALLGEALGLKVKIKDCSSTNENGSSRFIEVSVERGWTSHKDFIGYKNPLNGELEASNTDTFQAFKTINDEVQADEAYIPMLILLDEANLSPMEHYWAAFLRICDLNGSNRTFNIGDEVQWAIPEHLRFLATVNFDHTTEELSPRFLDRSWVIPLESPKNLIRKQELSLRDMPGPISYKELKAAFGLLENKRFENEVWKRIQEVFQSEEVDLALSPRNIFMVEDYCNTAVQYMKEKISLDGTVIEKELAALDYAVLQKILPTINGYGERFDILIEKLIDCCPKLPESQKHLKRMKRHAENNAGFYQFFTR